MSMHFHVLGGLAPKWEFLLPMTSLKKESACRHLNEHRTPILFLTRIDNDRYCVKPFGRFIVDMVDMLQLG